MPMSGRLLRPRQTGFDPRSIADIVHWFDASDASTLGITGSPAGVETWTSKAGAKSVASQTTPENRPTTTTVNGRTAILFDGSNDGMTFAGTARTDETWVVACAQLTNQTATRLVIGDADGRGIAVLLSGSNRFIESSWPGFTIGVNRIQVVAVSGSVALPPSVLSVPRSTATGIVFRRNGSQLATATTSGSTTVNRIGFISSSSFQFDGWIGEVLCWSRALAVEELQRVERYLGKKWGIAVA